jgi:hypothetical protein
MQSQVGKMVTAILAIAIFRGVVEPAKNHRIQVDDGLLAWGSK